MRRAAMLTGVTVALCLGAEGVSAQGAGPSSAGPMAPLASTAPGRWTLSAEALVWWFKDSPMPAPLVTDGIVGEPDTQVFIGGQGLETGANPGFRINAGYGLSATSSLEANVFYIPSRSVGKSKASTGQLDSTDLLIPFIDAAFTHFESATNLSLAPIYSGSAREEFSNNLLGAELNGAWALAPVGGWRTDLLAGFRYLRLREDYTLTTDSPYIPPFPQDIWITTDTFNTTNHFYGAQVGLRGRFEQGAFFASGTAKVALGAMAQSVDIGGSLVTNDYTDYGPTVTYPGGWFALPTNIGNYSRTAFAVVPEVALNLGYRLTPSVALTFGYSFLYASNVARPGKQINRTINWTQSTAYTEDPNPQIVGPAQPTFQFNDSAFWAQGVNVGLAVRF